MPRRNTSTSQSVETYEIPQGVVVENGREEKTFRVLPSRTPGLVFIHIQVNTADRRKYYQTIEVDPEHAALIAGKINVVAEQVKTELPESSTNGSKDAERP